MAKKIFQKIADILLRPFREHFLFFLVLCALTVSGHSLGYFNGNGEMNLNATIATAMHCIGISYSATLIVGIAQPKIVRQILQTAFILFAAFDFALNFYCSLYLHYLFDSDIARLILETDPNEAMEFFSAMVPTWMILAIAGVFLLLFFLWWLFKRSNLKLNLGKKASWLALALVCICFCVNLKVWGVWKYGPIAPIYQLTQHDVPSDLKDYFSHPQLTIDETNEMPTNVVLIIGESFGRCHSSIYGYDKLTNPQLAELKDNSLLYAFDSISSPAPSTALSLRDMLSTFNLSDENEEKMWYEYISLIEIMKDCGYDSYWFGNQPSANRHNGTSRVLAKACDRQWFLQIEGLDDVGDHLQDIVLVDSSYQYVDQLSKKDHNFFVYHMMGSHFNFSNRYPKEYAKFSVNDYSTEPQSHREILSSYDNSILYNDYIVRKIMDLFKDSEAIVIYLSDHGQVMYRNTKDPDFYAHGRKGDPVDYALGVEVPFFVYASPLFQQKHPDAMERIKNRQEHPKSWNSEDLPYFIMDLIGVKAINGEEVRPRSVLN